MIHISPSSSSSCCFSSCRLLTLLCGLRNQPSFHRQRLYLWARLRRTAAIVVSRARRRRDSFNDLRTRECRRFSTLRQRAKRLELNKREQRMSSRIRSIGIRSVRTFLRIRTRSWTYLQLHSRLWSVLEMGMEIQYRYVLLHSYLM